MRTIVHRISVPVLLAGAVVFVLGATVAVAALRTPPPPPSAEVGIPPTPPTDLHTVDIPTIEELIAQGMTSDEAGREHARLRAEWLREQEAAGRMRLVPVSGPETAGTRITVAGREIQLPPDAQMDGVMISGTCPVGALCPETPAYIILRHGEALTIDRVGQVWGAGKPRPLAPDEIPATFAFVREALR